MSVLLDTGPLVALIDSGDPAHKQCLAAFEQLRGPLLTTEAVLTEALYLLRAFPAQDKALSVLLRGAAQMVPTDTDSLSAIRDLMGTYSDIPMDYADATLVQLAAETGVDQVFTLDRRGFSCYRLGRGRAFRILP